MSSGRKDGSEERKQDDDEEFDIRNLGKSRRPKSKKPPQNTDNEDDDDFFSSDNIGSGAERPPRVSQNPSTTSRRSQETREPSDRPSGGTSGDGSGGATSSSRSRAESSSKFADIRANFEDSDSPISARRRPANIELETSPEDEFDRIEQTKKQILRILPLCQKGDYGALEHALRFLEKEGVPDSPTEKYAPLRDVIDPVSFSNLDMKFFCSYKFSVAEAFLDSLQISKYFRAYKNLDNNFLYRMQKIS